MGTPSVNGTDSAITVADAGPGIVTVTLGRPPVNALSTVAYQQIRDAFRDLAGRGEVRVVVLRSGLERIFCAGADLNEVTAIAEGRSELSDITRQRIARQMLDSIHGLPQVTIAAVNGPAIGAGAALISVCDIRLGTPRASISLPEINVGRCGGARHWMRLLPQGIIREMYFTGQPLPAQDALRLGVYNRLVPPEELPQAAMDLAGVIAAKGPQALRLAKEAINGCEELPLSAGYAYEQMFTLRLGETQEARDTLHAALARMKGR
ncbi:MAG: enoyl-CoA hydratase-related protein [Actinomycetota bacterium]|nr:enoyl-CoA hydratase-related protein [Actinomycetota bacterium]